MKTGERVMLFQVGRRLYGIDLNAVRKVLPEEYVTPVPRMPGNVAGAILFEGQAVPVFYIEENPAANGSERLILVLQHASGLMGVAIDNVLRLIELEKGQLDVDGKPLNLVSPGELIPPELVGS